MSLSPRDDEPDDHVRPGEAVDGALGGALDGAGGGAQQGGEDSADDGAADGAADSAADGARPSPLDDADAETAAWEAIVANYGERPRWDPPAAPSPHPEHPAGRGRRRHDDPDSRDGAGGGDESDLGRGHEERYVPPPPPPLPRTTPARLLAWLGLLAVPVTVMVLAIAGVRLPMWGETLLVAWFVGGFSFLVATMRREHDEPDDGAVL